MAHRRKFSLGRAGVLVVLLGIGAQPAAAQTCIQDVWKSAGNNQNLTCTAQDVTLSDVTNINITAGGNCVDGVCRCFLGGNVTFTADFQMDLTADTRYDTGFYIATDGDVDPEGALTGACAATNITSTNASDTFTNLDAAPDTCGDITGPLGTDFNPQVVHFQVTMPCSDPDGNEQLDLPWCTTWRQPGSNEVCDSASDAYPGSPSKCNCGLEPVPIFFETATIEVTKTATTTSVPETGGSASYSVSVRNLALVSSVKLDTLTDDKYGDITTTHAAGGGFLAVTATTCTLATIPAGNVAGNPYTCTFTGTVPPGDFPGSFTDVVTACGTDDFEHSNLCDNDDATVNYSDVLQDPTLTKTATGTACQIDATYAVVATNNSAQDTLTLNTLSDDKFGSITAAHAAGGGFEEVVSTTCAVPQTIQPVGNPSGNNYSCSFVGRINSCSISHTDVVTGTATDDDGASYTKTDGATVIINVTTP